MIADLAIRSALKVVLLDHFGVVGGQIDQHPLDFVLVLDPLEIEVVRIGLLFHVGMLGHDVARAPRPSGDGRMVCTTTRRAITVR